MKTKSFNPNFPKTVKANASGKRFPLQDFTLSLFPDVNLENTYVIGEQHIVSTTFEMVESLFKKGLKKENLSLIGKCYSTNPYVYAQMVQSGIDVSLSSLRFDPLESYDRQYKRAARRFYYERQEKVQSKQVTKVVILSDGGILNEIAQDKRSHFLSSTVGVEQTSSGYEKLKKTALQYPVVNVARSEAKLEHESPFIARLSLERLFYSFTSLGLSPKRILIIGNGAIGRQVYSILHPNYSVEIFDIDQTKGTILKKDFESSLAQFDLILGCTGNKTISADQYRFLKKNAILASLSSSDREFDAVHLRQRFKGKMTDCHQHLFVDGLYLMNCGFPIIFDPFYDTIDTSEFQLTRSLLLAGILQGASHLGTEKGFISLDYEDQREIIQKYHRNFKTEQKVKQ